MSDMDTQKGCVMGSRNEYYKQYYIKNQDKKKSMALKRYYDKRRPLHLKERETDDIVSDLIDTMIQNPNVSNSVRTTDKKIRHKINAYKEKKRICDKIFKLRSIGDSDIIISKIDELKKEYYVKFKEKLDI